MNSPLYINASANTIEKILFWLLIEVTDITVVFKVYEFVGAVMTTSSYTLSSEEPESNYITIILLLD